MDELQHFKSLSEEEQVNYIVEKFPQLERDYAYAILNSIDPDALTYESLDLAVKEFLLMGGIGNSLITVVRENHDLRATAQKERRLFVISLIALIVCIGLIALLMFLFASYPKYRTVQTVDNSVICEIDPKDNPALTDAAIQDFARSAVLASYSFDYVSYRDQLEYATTRYFTSEGRAAFNRALRSSGSLNHIISNNLIMKTFVTSAAQIEDKGIDGNTGQAYWVVRMPVTTEFYTGGSKPADTQKFVAQVRVVSTTRDALNTKGIGVHSLTLRPPKAE